MSDRRKRYRVVLIASLVAAFIVPVGFALSLESGTGRRNPLHETAASAGIAVSIAVPRSTASDIAQPLSHAVTDAVKLLIVGSVLIGLAAAVRKAS